MFILRKAKVQMSITYSTQQRRVHHSSVCIKIIAGCNPFYVIEIVAGINHFPYVVNIYRNSCYAELHSQRHCYLYYMYVLLG